MSAPTQAADNVPGVGFYGEERIVESSSSYCIIDNVEAIRSGMPGNVGFHTLDPIVDRGRSIAFDYLCLLLRNRGEDLCIGRMCKLHRGVSDTAGSCMDENSLSGMNLGTIHQTLPSRDKNERKCSSLSH